jgi:hypothetical protein
MQSEMTSNASETTKVIFSFMSLSKNDIIISFGFGKSGSKS